MLVERKIEQRRMEHYYPAALICCQQANMHRDREEHPEPYPVSVFMPIEGDDLDRPDTTQADETAKMVAKVEWLTVMFDGVELPPWAKKPKSAAVRESAHVVPDR